MYHDSYVTYIIHFMNSSLSLSLCVPAVSLQKNPKQNMKKDTLQNCFRGG